MSTFSENLLYLKEKANLSSSELGRKLGVHTSTITRLLRPDSEPRRTSINQISSQLGMEAYVLEQVKHEEKLDIFDQAADVLRMLPDAGTSVPVKKDDANLRRARKEDVQIEPDDLFDFPLLSSKYARAQAMLHEEPDSLGLLSLVMPTDELAPTAPRGSIVYLSVEKNPHCPSPSQEFAVGLIEDKHIYTFGILEIAKGRMFITPINPRLKAEPAEVSAVVARVEAWMVFFKK